MMILICLDAILIIGTTVILVIKAEILGLLSLVKLIRI